MKKKELKKIAKKFYELELKRNNASDNKERANIELEIMKLTNKIAEQDVNILFSLDEMILEFLSEKS